MEMRTAALVTAAVLAATGWGMQRVGSIFGTFLCLLGVGLAVVAMVFF